MQLVADRFVAIDEGAAIDLASGEHVQLVIDDAGDAREQARWLVRCDALHRLTHPAIAQLVDYGVLGIDRRFEAWRCGGTWRGAPEEARRAADRAVLFLRASALTGEDVTGRTVRECDGRAVVLPDVTTGYPRAVDSPSFPMSLDAVGLAAIERPAISALTEMFAQDAGTHPRIAALWGPPGSGKRAAARTLARAARVNGFIPVDACLMVTTGVRFADVWCERSVFIIAHATARATSGWRALLELVSRVAQPHALLLTGEVEQPGIDGVSIGRVPADTLVAAIRPSVIDERLLARIRRAADDSRGLPGRFCHALWGRMSTGSHDRRDRQMISARVAETPVVYAPEDLVATAEAGQMSRPAGAMWPGTAEVATLRRRTEAAMRQLTSGRHEPGARLLRQLVSAFGRRDMWIDAAAGGLALARAQLRRGRVADAQATLAETRQYAQRSGQESILLDVAIACGKAWIDAARLDDAESVLGAALTAARASGDTARTAVAAIAMARTLFWRGRYDEAIAMLCGVSGVDDLDLTIAIGHTVLHARCRVAQRDISRAISLVTRAIERAAASGDQTLIARAHSGGAFVYLAVNDTTAVERHVASAVAAARAAHDPLEAIRARLLLAEAARRNGTRSVALSLVQRLARRDRMPPLIAARCRLVADLAVAGNSTRTIVDKHVRSTGLGALALYATESQRATAANPLVDDLVAIVHACQAADDEVTVLTEVCRRVRDRLRAAAVACVLVARAERRVIASDGARMDGAIAETVAAAGITIAPYLASDRIEAAAPVQYGGVTLGAICARWTVGSTSDRSRASGVLTAAAAAIAPIVSVASTRLNQPVISRANDVLGVAASIVELRQAIERAAAAPFSVLIEGESGSGKELVARAIHRSGVRRDRAFCTLNCAALPDDLVEAELFGHARGSFTGAIADRPGVFEEAHGGTLLLDEVGELSPRAQAKVLRVIQEGELRRVGENVSRRVDVRLLAATNRDLREEVARGRFRLDLLYRIDVIRIVVPPLRDRREDIALLAEQFWRDATMRVGSRATLGAATLAALARYDWPGNVRELQNVLASLAVRCGKRGVVPPTALPPAFGEAQPGDGWRLDAARRSFEERFVRAALVRSGGHRARAAAELGVTRQGLAKLMTRLGIESRGVGESEKGSGIRDQGSGIRGIRD